MLLPRAAVARDVIPVELQKLGAAVDVVEAYRNVPPSHKGPVPKADWITFTSSSTVQNYVEIAGRESAALRFTQRWVRPCSPTAQGQQDRSGGDRVEDIFR